MGLHGLAIYAFILHLSAIRGIGLLAQSTDQGVLCLVFDWFELNFSFFFLSLLKKKKYERFFIVNYRFC